MKFGKNILNVVELCDPEWGPYWINYKFLKKKLNEIVKERDGMKISESQSCNPAALSKFASEVEFFRALKKELKDASEFFSTTEHVYRIRHSHVKYGYFKLQEHGKKYDKNTWSRLLRACVKLYKDIILLENFAIMNYCGFSKILKKHDKQTGFSTREAFMRNVMNQQNFTHHPHVIELLKQSEILFADIQRMESFMPLGEEEQVFIDAIRDMNRQASFLHRKENHVLDSSDGLVITAASAHEVEAGQLSDGSEDCALSRAIGVALSTNQVDREPSITDISLALSWMQKVQSGCLSASSSDAEQRTAETALADDTPPAKRQRESVP